MCPDALTSRNENGPDAARYIGLALVAGFLLPLVITGFGFTKILFVNISMLGKGSFFQTLMLLHPLIAGILVLQLSRRVEGLARPIVLLATGLFPVALTLGDDLLSGSLRGLKLQTTASVILVLAVIGLFVGSRHTAATGYASGRWIAAISGAAFLLVSLVPVTGAKPVFFALFDLLGMGRITRTFVLLGVVLIGVFLCYIYAALTAFINLKEPPNIAETSERAAGVVFWASCAVPLAFLAVSLSGGGFFMVALGYVKFTLWVGGVILLIGWAWMDLMEELEPPARTGAQLFAESAPAAAAPDRAPPNIWDGPPPEP